MERKIRDWLHRDKGNTNWLIIFSWVIIFVAGLIIGKLWL